MTFSLRSFANICIAFLLFTGPLAAQLQQGWSQRASLPGPARHRSVCVTIGERLYLGIGHVNAVVDILYDDWWEYDPGSNAWTQKANFGGGQRHHGFGFVINNKAYVGMGRAPGNTLPRDVWEYDPLTNVWVAKNLFPGQGRRGPVSFSIGNKGYVCTGNSASGYLNDLWEYDPSTDSWMQRAPFPPGTRFACVGFSIGSKGYVGTGEQASMPSGSKNDFWEYSPSTNTWLQRANVPGPARLAACGFAHQGMGYVGTGEDFQSGNNFSDFYRYDVASNTWDTINEFIGLARRYMVGTSLGTHAFVGTGTNGTNFQDLWEYGYMTGMEEVDKPWNISVFPNPVMESAVFSFGENDTKDAVIKIYSLGGTECRSAGVQGNEFIFRRENLPPGTYIYSITRNQMLLGSGKIILQ